MLMHADAFKAQGKPKNDHLVHIRKHTQTDRHYHPKAFVIPLLPAVIDWSICLCVVYKWGTWYSALFIWNWLRQRCCVSTGSLRGSVSLSLTHMLSVALLPSLISSM